MASNNCSDGIDSDGDGLTDCRDDDCAGSVDCGEICEADADEDGDGFFECDDSECFRYLRGSIIRSIVFCIRSIVF